jgi:multiple sugar transport system substrate-binding protein
MVACFRNIIALTAIGYLILLLSGCDGSKGHRPAGEGPLPLAGVKFRLLVIDDPAMATAAERLRGEWKAQTGGDFEVVRGGEKDLRHADGIICPSALIGTLAAAKRLAPLPEEMVRGDAGQWSDIFELLRLREAAWGSQIVAVPLGSPVLACCYRSDLLEKVGRRPPQTWEEYQELAQLLGRQKPPGNGPWHGAIEPLGPGWAGLTLLARAAPYAKHGDNYSTLFDIKTMAPLVAGPPWVKALEELVAAAKQGPAEELQYDPAAVRAEFYRGHCGLALSWPTAADNPPASKAAAHDALRVGFIELPGSPQAYNVGSKTWETRGEEVDPHVPLLGVAGRMAAVSADAQRPEAVFQLLLWLSEGQRGRQLCSSSPATTLFRRSQLKSPQEWTEKAVSPAEAAQYAALTARTLNQPDYLPALRLPGQAEYLAALDEAVYAAVRGQATPAEALRQAAARWGEITRRLGVPQQRSAYRHSLGLEEERE